VEERASPFRYGGASTFPFFATRKELCAVKQAAYGEMYLWNRRMERLVPCAAAVGGGFDLLKQGMRYEVRLEDIRAGRNGLSVTLLVGIPWRAKYFSCGQQ